MKTTLEIKERLVEIRGDYRNLSNKKALGLDMSCEEYDAMDDFVVEQDALLWVLGVE